MISPFREDFIFTKLRIYAKFRENKMLAKISEFTVQSTGAFASVFPIYIDPYQLYESIYRVVGWYVLIRLKTMKHIL